MFFYKGKPLFAIPQKFSTGDIEFNIYDTQGNFLGTNFIGISKNTYYTENERYELEELIQDLTIDLEIKIKFAKEYGIEISNWKSIKKSKGEIINSMVEKWNISKRNIDKYFID